VVSKTVTRVQRGAGRLSQTVTDSSFDAWNKFYKQDENAPNAIVSYYAKGALVALCLDAELRHRSNNEISLDDLLKRLWANWLENPRGLAEDEPEKIAIDMLDASHKEEMSLFFQHSLYSTEELPLEAAFEKLGAALAWRRRVSYKDAGGGVDDDRPACVWLGATLKAASGGVSLLQVFTDTPAEQAGLAAGDVLIAVNKLQVSVDSIESVLMRYGDCKELSVDYFRLGELRTATIQVNFDRLNTANLRRHNSDSLNLWLGTPSQLSAIN